MTLDTFIERLAALRNELGGSAEVGVRGDGGEYYHFGVSGSGHDNPDPAERAVLIDLTANPDYTE